jgi:predicted N-acetyltransferase YhbS
LITLVPLSSIAPDQVEHLLDDAFGTDRHHRTAYRLREGMPFIDALSFAAVENGQLLGSIQAWPASVRNAEGADPIILVGPVAVTPELQGRGIGKMLMARLLETADAGAADAMVMIGDPDYYGRFFGFHADSTSGWDVAGPVERHRLLARIRRPGGVRAIGQLGPDPSFATGAVAA